MSLVSIGRLGRDLMRNTALRKSFQENPEEALSRYPHSFSPEERAALLAGDVGTLYRMGANAFLMGYLPAIAYSGWIRRATASGCAQWMIVDPSESIH